MPISCASSKLLPASVPWPLPDVEAGAEETSARETNRMLREGWRLLQVIHAHDAGGGYPVYVVGRVRSVQVPGVARAYLGSWLCFSSSPKKYCLRNCTGAFGFK